MDEYLTMLHDCEVRESRLTDWEREFVDSLSSQFRDGQGPSPKQVDRLNVIWERATERG